MSISSFSKKPLGLTHPFQPRITQNADRQLLERTRLLKNFHPPQGELRSLKRAARDILEKHRGPFWQDFANCKKPKTKNKFLATLASLLSKNGKARLAKRLENLSSPKPPLDNTLKSRRKLKFLFEAGLGASLMLFLHLYVFRFCVVRGQSMEPTLHQDDHLILDCLPLSLNALHRFDIVVFKYPPNQNIDFVKRVIAFAGERIALKNGQLLINGQFIPEPFLEFSDRADFPETEIQPGFIFVLGDNRPNSLDSREFGLVPVELLRGKARVCFWPLERIGIYEER